MRNRWISARGFRRLSVSDVLKGHARAQRRVALEAIRNGQPVDTANGKMIEVIFFMSRKRKTIPHDVQLAQQRVNGMVSVEPRLDLGNGVSVESVAAAIRTVTDGIGEYNSMLADLDARSNLIEANIRAMNDIVSRALKGAEFKFGGDSNEYQQIGGTRKSDRKRPGRKKTGGTGEMK
jgi:hypothetical protein